MFISAMHTDIYHIIIYYTAMNLYNNITTNDYNRYDIILFCIQRNNVTIMVLYTAGIS